ncbi:MAG: hypothetical protein AB1416_14180, partial [Actinomycetota bacterium]
KLVGVTSDGPPIQDCTSPTPSGAGAGSATYSAPNGNTFQTEWSVPAEITPGATAFIRLQATPGPGQSLGAGITIKTPSEFGLAPLPNSLEASLSPGGSFNQSKTFTFTPQRAFTAGETLYIRLENGCTAFTYRYVVS